MTQAGGGDASNPGALAAGADMLPTCSVQEQLGHVSSHLRRAGPAVKLEMRSGNYKREWKESEGVFLVRSHKAGSCQGWRARIDRGKKVGEFLRCAESCEGMKPGQMHNSSC